MPTRLPRHEQTRERLAQALDEDAIEVLFTAGRDAPLEATLDEASAVAR